jgi:steroid 5-alpha reductase family enzyme
MTLTFAIAALAGVAAALALNMSIAWMIWRLSGNSGWVDTVWTFGLGVIGIGGALLPSLFAVGGVSAREMLVAALVTVWSLRLGLHIGHRTAGIVDDPRYAALIATWGAKAAPQMFILLQKQALLTIPLALSMLVAAWNPAPGLRVQDYAGAALLLVAICGAELADAQLRRFRADAANRGRICDDGLWSWSRHPNYFFEWLGWLAYPVIAIDLGGYLWGWLALAGPACMYWLLVHVSGIPPLEAHMVRSRGDAFRAYRKRTSAFFPLPPRN